VVLIERASPDSSLTAPSMHFLSCFFVLYSTSPSTLSSLSLYSFNRPLQATAAYSNSHQALLHHILGNLRRGCPGGAELHFHQVSTLAAPRRSFPKSCQTHQDEFQLILNHRVEPSIYTYQHQASGPITSDCTRPCQDGCKPTWPPFCPSPAVPDPSRTCAEDEEGGYL
jgi:hypothetical protein